MTFTAGRGRGRPLPHYLAALAAPVDRKSLLPAWAQVHRDLRLLIHQGMEVGGRPLAKIEMAAIYGVSPSR